MMGSVNFEEVFRIARKAFGHLRELHFPLDPQVLP